MSASERQKRWRDGKNRKGMTRLDLWVPTDRADSVRTLIADLISYPEMKVIGVKPEGAAPAALVAPGYASVSLCNTDDGDDLALSPVAMRDAVRVSLDELSEHELGTLARFILKLTAS